jgi:phosphoglycolate phosphatase/pyrophosphatase PpaX
MHTLGIVTSGSRSRVVNDLERLGIAGRFATVVTGDDISQPKPAPEALELALRHLSVSPHAVVYIGDAHADFEMSRAAGVRFIGVASEFANLADDHPEYEVYPIESLPDVIGSLR